MLDLNRREKIIILVLIATLLIGIIFTLYQKSNCVTDVKIKAFNYEGLAEGPKKININEADEVTLMALPGVGKALAGRILAYKNENGYFRSIDEIKKVRGIKESLFDKIKNNISIE